MMPDLTLQIFSILVLLLANGVFAMAEIAVVASRKARLKALADAGHGGAKLALDLTASPGKFLSTIQVGITLVGVLAGAVGGGRIAGFLTKGIAQIPGLERHADYLALFIVVAVITYFSVVIGELVPKRLALNNPEKLASLLARPMNGLSTLFSPVINLLSFSSDFLLAAMGVKKAKETTISEEEVRVLIDEGLIAGVFKKTEKDMLEGVFKLDEQIVDDLMTPRARVIWLSLDDSDEENWRKIAGSGHSHFPVYQGTRDNVIGMVSVKSLWANLSLAGQVELRALVTPPLYVPTTMTSARLIELFKKSGKHIALVVDEFGGQQGLVTLNDVMIAIVGDLPEREQQRDPKALLRGDGTWLMDAMLDIEETKNRLGIQRDLPGEKESRFSTLGGFLLFRFGHIPSEGDKFLCEHFEFEVIDMDRQRIDKVLVTPRPPPKVEDK